LKEKFIDLSIRIRTDYNIFFNKKIIVVANFNKRKKYIIYKAR